MAVRANLAEAAFFLTFLLLQACTFANKVSLPIRIFAFLNIFTTYAAPLASLSPSFYRILIENVLELSKMSKRACGKKSEERRRQEEDSRDFQGD